MYGYFRTHRLNFAALAGLCFALFSVSSLAVTIDMGPSSYTAFGPNGSHHVSGIRSTYGQRISGNINTMTGPISNLPATVNRNPVVPYGSVAQGMKNFVRVTPGSVAASAAVTLLFLAVDWVFDQDTGEWVVMGDPTLLDDPNIKNWRYESTDGFLLEGSSAESLCISVVPTVNDNYVYIETVITSPTTARCRATTPRLPNGANVAVISRVSNTCPSPSAYNDDLGGCVIPGEYESLSESDWSELEAELPNQSPATVSQAAGDTMRKIGAPLPGYFDTPITGPSSISGPTTTTTTTNPSTGDTSVTETSTQTYIEYGDTTITVTETSTSTTYNSDGSPGTTTTTTTTPGEAVVSGSGGDTEWPGFCDWATVVCDWFDWTQDGWDQEEPDLPQIIDFDSSGDYQVGGSGECPAPYNINLGWMLNTTLEVSYQPFCDFAGLVKPLFLAFCYLFAGVITVRSL